MKDINEFFEFHSKRVVDPLSPRYTLVNEENQKFEYGAVRGNKSMIRHPKEPHRVMSFDLKTDDIEGAHASTATEPVRKINTRNNINRIDDIPGAQVHSLKKGITTNRHLDPLRPQYKLPGHSEMPPDFFRNSKPVGLSKHATEKKILPSIEQKSAVPVQSQRQEEPKSQVSADEPIRSAGIAKKVSTENKLQLDDVKFDGNRDVQPQTVEQNTKEFFRGYTPTGDDPKAKTFSNLLAGTGQRTLGRSATTTNALTKQSIKKFYGVEDRGLVSSGSDFQRSAEQFFEGQGGRMEAPNRGTSTAKEQGTTLDARVSIIFFN